MKSVPAKFPCKDITLEGEWLLPGGKGPFPCVILCHPHPPSGGNMRNSVVTAIWQTLSRHPIAAFRFNFRGVGSSEGSFDNGIGEQQDVRAALDFVLSSPNVDSKKIGLAGYSFGAMMALLAARKDERISRLALVSAPLSDLNWEQLKKYDKPRLFLVGDADQMVSLEGFRQQVKNIPNPELYQIIPGADHFLGGYEEEVAQRVSRFFAAGFSGI